MVLLMLKLTTRLGWNLFFFLIFIYMFLISLCKDGTVTFWNPESGKDIASEKIDYSTEDIKEENPEVVSLHFNPDLFFNNCRVPLLGDDLTWHQVCIGFILALRIFIKVLLLSNCPSSNLVWYLLFGCASSQLYLFSLLYLVICSCSY